MPGCTAIDELADFMTRFRAWFDQDRIGKNDLKALIQMQKEWWNQTCGARCDASCPYTAEAPEWLTMCGHPSLYTFLDEVDLAAHKGHKFPKIVGSIDDHGKPRPGHYNP